MTINNIPETNVGFDIIATAKIGEDEAVVLGQNGASEFVTWIWSKHGGFFWGHYHNSRTEAYKEYFARVSESLRI